MSRPPAAASGCALCVATPLGGSRRRPSRPAGPGGRWRAGCGLAHLDSVAQHAQAATASTCCGSGRGWLAGRDDGLSWTADKENHGVRGVRPNRLEVVHNPNHVERPSPRRTPASCKRPLRTRSWRNCGPRSPDGSPAASNALEVCLAGLSGPSPVAVGTGGRLANYLFKGTTIHSTTSPDLTCHPVAPELTGRHGPYQATAAISGARRRVQVRTSNHIDRLCDSGPRTSDKKGSNSTITRGTARVTRSTTVVSERWEER